MRLRFRPDGFRSHGGQGPARTFPPNFPVMTTTDSTPPPGGTPSSEPADGDAPLVGVIMGSRSDWSTMEHAVRTLESLQVPHEVRVVSAHRTPELLFDYAGEAAGRGLRVIIAGAGGAAHLPGMVAARTALPVLGVPVQSRALQGLDSLLSIVQMPGGVPVGTLAIGKAGAVNSALLAASILGLSHEGIRSRLEAWRAARTQAVLADPDPSIPPAS